MKKLIFLQGFKYGHQASGDDRISYAVVEGVDRQGRSIVALAEKKKADMLNRLVDESTPEAHEPGDVGIVVSVSGVYDDTAIPNGDRRSVFVIHSFDLVSGPALELMHIKADAAEALEKARNAETQADAYAILRDQIAQIAGNMPAAAATPSKAPNAREPKIATEQGSNGTTAPSTDEGKKPIEDNEPALAALKGSRQRERATAAQTNGTKHGREETRQPKSTARSCDDTDPDAAKEETNKTPKRHVAADVSAILGPGGLGGL